MKKLLAISILGVITVMLSNCGNNAEESDILRPPENPGYWKEGLKLVSQNCISCHSADHGMGQDVAPDLKAVKESYGGRELSEAEFVAEMTAFLLTPVKGNARMAESVEQYGLMPNLGYSREQYEAVSTYLYRSDIDDPEWYQGVFLKDQVRLLGASDSEEGGFLEKGRNIALSTKSVLGKNLLAAIKEKGTAGALEFCNERAIHLTDSMARELNASVRRVSDQNRNPGNLAKGEELEYIQWAKAELASGGKASPRVIETPEKAIGYYPILTNEMCLQCHGSISDDIQEETREKLSRLYPHDLATGYGSNQLRGIWVVEMEK